MPREDREELSRLIDALGIKPERRSVLGIHQNSRAAEALRDIASVPGAVGDNATAAAAYLFADRELEQQEPQYNPIAEALRPPEPKERASRTVLNEQMGPASGRPVIDEVLEVASRLQETPQFTMQGNKPLDFSFNSLNVNSDEYPVTSERGAFSRSNRSIGDLARERQEARDRLIARDDMEHAARIKMAIDDPNAPFEVKHAAINAEAMRRQEQEQMEQLRNQAEATLLARSNGDPDYSTHVMKKLGDIVDREIAQQFKPDGKNPVTPATRQQRVKELLMGILNAR